MKRAVAAGLMLAGAALSAAFFLGGALLPAPTLGTAVPPVQAPPAFLDPAWANKPIWHDGQAEVAFYEASMVIYGKPRAFEYVYVLVKEDFTPEYRVKADGMGGGQYPVMKCNQFARVPTDNYPYHFLTSLFFRWENPAQLHKLTASSQEWCGHTFKEYLENGQGFSFQYHSYWDGEGSGKEDVPAAWFEDQLPYTLRALRFADGLSFERPLYPTEKHSRARRPQAQTASFSVSSDGDQWRVDVRTPNGPSRYWFAKAYPNALQRQESWNGLQLSLRKIDRYPYWAYTPEHMQAP